MSKWNTETFYAATMQIPWSGCWVWMSYCKTTPSPNYLQPWMRYKGKAQAAARVAWQIYNGAIQEKAHVLHTCDNCYCVNPAHLYIGTHTDNMRDMNEHGRASGKYGALGFTGLTEAKKMREQGLTNKQIGEQLGFHHKSISRALNGGHWAAAPAPGGLENQ